MKKVHLSGDLLLSSEASEKLFQKLSQDGLLLEFLSSLFEERAHGIAASDLAFIKEKVTSLEKKVDILSIELQNAVKPLKSIDKVGVGDFMDTPTPKIHQGESSQTESSNKVSTATLDLKKLQGSDALSLLSKMKKMTGKK